MYETPKLIYAGAAHELVLGIPGLGFDLDGSQTVQGLEFEDDPATAAESL